MTKYRRTWGIACVCVVVLALFGCAVGSSSGALGARETEARSADELARLFIDRARQLIQRDRLDEAEANLARALNQRPENAWAWFEMARIREKQGQFQQADYLAQRSIDLTDKRSLLLKNWKLIARVRSQRGDRAGYLEARDRVMALRQP